MQNLLLNLPDKLPRSADQSTNILEPGETDKDSGFGIDSFVPSAWLNWLHKLQYEWSRSVAKTALGTWRPGYLGTHPLATGEYCVYSSIAKKWFLMHTGASLHYHINDSEFDFDNVGTPSGLGGGFMYPRARAYDSSRWIVSDYVVGVNNQIAYASYTSPSSFTGVNTGLNQGITAIGMKRPIENDDYILAGYTTGIIRKSANVTTGWSAITTETGNSSDVKCIQYMGNENWICMDVNGYTFISIDDGDSWAATTNTPRSVNMTASANFLGFNPNSGVVCACGGTGTTKIVRSPNGGHDWTVVTLNVGGRSSSLPTVYKVIYIGGDCWIACGSYINPSSPLHDYPGIYVSFDDGKTWTLPSWPIEYADTTALETCIDMDCNGRFIMAYTTGGNFIYMSDAIAGEDGQ